MRLLIALLALLAVVPATAAAQEPTATTGAAESVGATTATLTGSAGPGASSYHFEYGTSTAYGLVTPAQQLPAADDPVAVKAAVGALTPSTTYHFRLVADGVAGADRSFKTTPAPTLPAITSLRAVDKSASSARLTARVDPGGAATTWHVEWGASAGFGNRTADQALPSGGAAVPISVALAGLPSYRRVYWRVVAVNAAGVKRSGRASFTTLRAPTALTLNRSPALASWGRSVTVYGRVRGAGVNGLAVALQQSSFPFDAGFHQVASTRSNRAGEFRFAPRPVFLATRFRAVATALVSPELATRVRSRVTIHRTDRRRRALRISGGVNPGLPAGTATLQRRTRAGAWKSVRLRALQTRDEVHSSYRFKVRREC
jgi:hypothetical protein